MSLSVGRRTDRSVAGVTAGLLHSDASALTSARDT
jgi:hypothetical protein